MQYSRCSTLAWLPVVVGACQGAGKDREVEPTFGAIELPAHGATAISPEPPLPSCASDDWTTYGHDPARTSASGGCLRAPLRLAWSFSPLWVKGTATHATRAIVSADAIYVSGAIGPTPTLWRLEPKSGEVVWTYVTMADASRDGWPTLAGGKVMLVDDGVYSVDATTGRGHRGELDAWGESLTDGERLYAENDRYWDGYGLYVSAFDLDARLLWRRDYDALVRFFTAPDRGGLAMEGGRIVHAAQHGSLRSTRLSAFDAVSGAPRWKVAVSPESSPSIADGRVYTVEHWRGETGDRLAARSLADGTLVWAREVLGARGPAPLLAGGLVVVHAQDGVRAFERSAGAQVWSAPIPRTAALVQSSTTMAAATGSGTLVVLSGGAVHLLQLADGSETWRGPAAPRARHVEGPIIAGSVLYAVADGALVRLDGAAQEPAEHASPIPSGVKALTAR